MIKSPIALQISNLAAFFPNSNLKNLIIIKISFSLYQIKPLLDILYQLLFFSFFSLLPLILVKLFQIFKFKQELKFIRHDEVYLLA
jgi:hypothetical protein